ncbi:MAG: YbhB/YbcL family Raf kinase inhibitor-like protein [Pyrinomonadaceae bacterium]
MGLSLSSTAFNDGGMIPTKYTCDGENISPPLEWSGVPPTAQSLALTVDDPDAPGKTWVHWVIYDVSPNTTKLNENIQANEKFADGAKQGLNDFKKIGYGGPCPPNGTHRYFFRLYSLNAATDLKPGASKDELLHAMQTKIISQSELMGTYKR